MEILCILGGAIRLRVQSNYFLIFGYITVNKHNKERGAIKILI